MFSQLCQPSVNVAELHLRVRLGKWLMRLEPKHNTLSDCAVKKGADQWTWRQVH